MSSNREDYFDDKKFSVKDAIVIVLCLVALAVLIAILYMSKTSSNEEHKQLVSDASLTNKVTDSAYEGILVNEVNQAGKIELYNSSKNTANLNGMIVYLNGAVLYQFTNDKVIDPKGFVSVDVKKTFDSESIIALEDKDGYVFFHMTVPKLDKFESYGSVTDGSYERGFMTDTMATSNNSATANEKKGLNYSVEGGFYSSNLSLKLSADSNLKIYYTLDGSQPTTESTQYTDAISITNRSGSNYTYIDMAAEKYYPNTVNMGTVVRAIAVDSNGSIVYEGIESYYIGLATSLDYRGLPVISLTGDEEDLFDYFTGIYVKGRSYEDNIAAGGNGANAGNYYNGWTKKVYMEYFETDKDKTYSGYTDLSMLVDSAITSEQKSFVVSGTGAAEGSSLKQYFNSSNGTFKLVNNGVDNGYKFRELLAGKLVSSTAVGASQYMQCIVFINGEYWGVYKLKSDFSETAIKKQYNVKSDIVVVEGNEINNPQYSNMYNELVNYIVKNDMSDASKYATAKSMIDMDSYIDYICTNMYLANASFGNDNAIFWRTVSANGADYEDGRWRVILGDMSGCMYNGNASRATTESIDTFLCAGFSQNVMIQSLLQSEEFRNSLKARMASLASNEFSEENVSEAISSVKSYIEKPALCSYKRFSGNYTDTYYSSELKKIEYFFEYRADYILKYTDEVVSAGGNTELINAARR